MTLLQMSQDYNSKLMIAREYASNANFSEFINISQQLIDENTNNVDAILSIGALLLNFGFVTLAKKCFLQLIEHFPNDLRATINLANVAKEMGEHHEANRLYNILLNHLPENTILRRNFLVGLQYDSAISDIERFNYAKEWGKWIISLTGGYRQRPVSTYKENEPLKIGYVSADFCQHTVGLFVKDIINSHDKSKVSIYTYSAGLQKDWVSEEICKNSIFRDISKLDDKTSALLMQNDKIDILVDLSGHTAGSRLSLFAYRPATVLVSWLGYFATTGLEYIDAVLLDDWHAPTEVEDQFIESIIRLPLGRLCYTPVPFAPEVSKSPFLKNGYITFGSFNNTAKYSEEVFNLWAKVLLAVPNSKLILKWRTFNDNIFQEFIFAIFENQGISKSRIELRGPSFHVDMLKEYADIDIALDPFPFCGGMTSCEALWMGIPVITLPQSRVVSRQTFAFLSAISLEEFVAKDFDTYVSIAVHFSKNTARLIELRENLRTQMLTSPLMNIIGFTKSLEDELISLYHSIISSD